MKFFFKITRRFKDPHILILIFLSILFNILVLSNVLQSDYFGDDLYNFQVSGMIPSDYSSMFEYIVETTKGWIASNGRLFPLGFYGYYIFDIFNESIYSYKLFVLLLIVLNVILFSYLVYISSNSKSLAVSVLLITPLLFQYRYYHDPILSFHGLMQTLWLFTTLSMLFLVEYLQRRKIKYYYLSLSFFILSLLTYEISYTFILLYIPLIFTQLNFRLDLKKAVKILTPYLLILLILTVYTLYLRSIASPESGPYKFSWSFFSIIETYFYQTISVLPTTYYFNFGEKINLNDLKPFALIIGTPILVYVYFSLTNQKNMETYKSKSLIILATFILLLPGLLISLSTKFQGSLGEMNAVKFGLSYIPIYIQTFGLSLLIALLIHRSSNVAHKILIFFVLLSVYILHYISNNQVINKVNAPYKNNREVLMQFLSGDFKDKLHNGDTIKIIGESPFHSKNFVSMVTNKNIKVALNENDNYIYQIQYEASKNTAVVNIYDNSSKKNFLVIYKKIGITWKEQYNEHKGGVENAGSILPIFNNFYNWEGKVGEFRWAKPNPSILWINSSNAIKPQKLLFGIKSLNARNIIINLNESAVYSLSLEPNTVYVVSKVINLQPGRNIIEFITEEPPIDPPGPDNRTLLFGIEKVHPFYQEDN